VLSISLVPSFKTSVAHEISVAVYSGMLTVYLVGYILFVQELRVQ
jgi:hypothetical protein